MSSSDKNRLTQTMLNNMKMHAYLNKNTFSRITDKPPEENRLNWNDIISKGPSWRKGENNDEDPLVISRKQETKLQEGVGLLGLSSGGCRKCGESGHFAFECMNGVRLDSGVVEKGIKEEVKELKEKIEELKLMKKIKKDKKHKDKAKKHKNKHKKHKNKEKKHKNKDKKKSKKDKKEKKRKGSNSSD